MWQNERRLFLLGADYTDILTGLIRAYIYFNTSLLHIGELRTVPELQFVSAEVGFPAWNGFFLRIICQLLD